MTGDDAIQEGVTLQAVREAFRYDEGDTFRHPEKPGVWEICQRFLDVDHPGGPSSPRSYRLMCVTEGEHHCESKRATEGEVYSRFEEVDNAE